ncbi:hypothetical protein Efla_006438 [Eimeria flavescens]
MQRGFEALLRPSVLLQHRQHIGVSAGWEAPRHGEDWRCCCHTKEERLGPHRRLADRKGPPPDPYWYSFQVIIFIGFFSKLRGSWQGTTGGAPSGAPPTDRNPRLRVPYGRLGDFVGQKIRFVGRIREAEQDALILEGSGGMCVKCFLQGVPPACRFVEVVATVQEDLTIKQEAGDQTVPLGDAIDLQTADAATAATFHPHFSPLFEPA